MCFDRGCVGMPAAFSFYYISGMKTGLLEKHANQV